MMFSIRRLVAALLLLLIGAASTPARIVLDFESDGPMLSVLESSASELLEVDGVPYSKMATPGNYEVRVSSDIVFSLEAEKVDLNLELKEPDLISNIRFKTRRLRLEEAQALANEIHTILNIETQELDEWFNGIRDDSELQNYSTANVDHYPAISLMLIRTLYQPEPVRLQVLFDWDIISTNRRGTTVEKNKLSGLRFDSESILEKVKIEQESVDDSMVVHQSVETDKDIEEKKDPSKDENGPRSGSLVEEKTVSWWPYVCIVGIFGVAAGYWMLRRR